MDALPFARLEFSHNADLPDYPRRRGRFAKGYDKPFYENLLLPPDLSADAAEQFNDFDVVRDKVMQAERRWDAQLYLHLVMALPASREVTDDDRIDLSNGFPWQKYVVNGLPALVVIHAPDLDDFDSLEANWHTHVIMPTRSLLPDGSLSPYKARHLFPVVRRGRVIEADPLGPEWGQFQDDRFLLKGYEVRCAPPGLIRQLHQGAVRYMPPNSEIAIENRLRIAANREATFNPYIVLDGLTERQATFDLSDLKRMLDNQLGKEDSEQKEGVRKAVLERAVRRYDPVTRKLTDRYTTNSVIEEERATMRAAQTLRDSKSEGVPADIAWMAAMKRTLSAEQTDAFEHAIGPGRLKIIVGRAGTGKSYTLGAIHDAFVMNGDKPWLISHTNKVVQDARKEMGVKKTATISNMLYQLEEKGLKLNSNEPVFIEEAGMVSTPDMKRLLEHFAAQNVRVILVGDDRQLPSIERSGIFPQLLHQQNASLPPRLRNYVELTEIRRQKVPWQQQMSRSLANYDFDTAIDLLQAKEGIKWGETAAKAESNLVDAIRDATATPLKAVTANPAFEPLLANRPEVQLLYQQAKLYEDIFGIAYTNEQVDRLNAGVRDVRSKRGELGADVELTVSHGEPQEGEEEELHKTNFAAGDRIQFTKTDKGLPVPVYNSQFATITAIDEKAGKIEVLVDGGDEGPTLASLDIKDGLGIRHGYVGTIYKAQGSSVKQVHVLHSQHWRADSAYVALTRQIDDVKLHVAEMDVKPPNVDMSRYPPGDRTLYLNELKKQISRRQDKSAAIAWMSKEEVEALDAGLLADPKALETAKVSIDAASKHGAATSDDGGVDTMDVDHESGPVTPQHVEPVSDKAQNTDSEGGIDAQPPVREEVQEAILAGLEEGRARFRENAEENRRLRWEAQVIQIMDGWYERVQQFRAQRDKHMGDPEYRAAREALLAYGQYLAGRSEPSMPTNTELLRVVGPRLGLARRQSLVRLLKADKPDQAVVDLVKSSEQRRENERLRADHVRTPVIRPRGRER